MITEAVAVRPAQASDQARIANLIYFEPYVHRHLDWRAPLDWLGAPEYWISEQENRALSAFACPPDPEGIAWIRLFVHTSSADADQVWEMHWQTAREYFGNNSGMLVAAIATQDWFRRLLSDHGFKNSQNIVLLEHRLETEPGFELPDGYHLRPMTEQDLPIVAHLDALAFQPLWQNSLPSLHHAFAQAGFASVMENPSGEMVAYQISTHNPYGAHLARLAVHPFYQGRRLGSTILQSLLKNVHKQGIQRLTVNTQSDNRASLALYQKAGFQITGEHYPVFTYSL